MTPIKVNTIVSNPRGNHIHSPFAFELVSKILFAKDNLTSRPELVSLANGLAYRKVAAIIRLVEFVRYKRIVLMGKDGEKWLRVVSKGISNPEVKCEYGPDVKLSLTNEVIVWFDAPTEPVIQLGANNSIWIFFDFEQNGSLLCFERLINDSRVSQTYRLNSSGIAIFNERFQKENFVIKGKSAY